MFPFYQLHFGSAVLLGLLSTAFITPTIQLISVLFGAHGPMAPIIVTLIVTVFSNFILEIVVYMVFAGMSLRDSSILPSGVYISFSILFPQLNVINVIDNVKYNTKYIEKNDHISFQAAVKSVAYNYARQKSYLTKTEYQTDSFATILLYSCIAFVAYSTFDYFAAFIKTEPMFQGMNPLKLWKVHRIVNENCLLQNLNITYRQGCTKTPAVSNFNLDFDQLKEKYHLQQLRLGLLGVSGAGKSSILNVLSGQVRPQGDCVKLFGLDLKKPENMYLIKRYVSLCPQLNENVVDGLSVYENIKFVLLLKGFDKNYQNVD